MTPEVLLQDLRDSRTDLARLVENVLTTRRNVVVVSSEAVGAWRARDPASWAKTHEWLAGRGVRVDVV
jgi:hypothetical protein